MVAVPSSLFSLLYVLLDASLVLGAQLEEPCETDSECRTPWSECLAGLCRCKEGFAASDAHCLAQAHSCPVGQPLADGQGVVRPCSRQSLRAGTSSGGLLPGFLPTQALSDTDPSRRVDTCPDGYSCFPYGSLVSNATLLTGHCCPAVRATCPIGLALSDAVCVLGRRGAVLRPGQRVCPSDTHYCTRAESILGAASAVPVCCPKPCNGPGAIFKDGSCFTARRYGQACQHNDQCAALNARCLDVGEVEAVCECDQGQVYVPLLSVCANAGCPVSGATPGLDSDGKPVRCLLLTNSMRGNTFIPALVSAIIQRQQSSLGVRGSVPVADCGPGWSCDPILQVCCPNVAG